MSQIGSGICDHCARGGPAVRSDAQVTPFIDLVGDTRAAIVPELYVPDAIRRRGTLAIGDGEPDRQRAAVVAAPIERRLLDRRQSRQHTVVRAIHRFGSACATRSRGSINARASLTLRASYAATTNLSLETYAAPFTSDGVYSNVRALSGAPLTAHYDDRFASYAVPATVPRAVRCSPTARHDGAALGVRAGIDIVRRLVRPD